MDYSFSDDSLMWIGFRLYFYVVPYSAYFLAIYIRRRCFPRPDAPPLATLLLLGVPVCLLVVTPILQAGYLTLLDSPYAYLLTIGTIMQQ